MRDRRDDEHRGGGSAYDAKVNVAEIGALNIGEIEAVRKRSRSETGPHDSGAAMRAVTSLTRFPIDVVSRRTPRGGDATTGKLHWGSATTRVVLLYLLLSTWVVPHVVSST